MTGGSQKLFLSLAGVAVLGVLVAGVFLKFHSGSDAISLEAFPTLRFLSTQTAATVPSSDQPAIQSALPVLSQEVQIKTTSGIERWYTNSVLKFSFRLPDGFSAPDIDTGVKGVYGVAVYNNAGAELVVLAYPIVEGSSISAAGIQANMPGVTLYDMQEKVIGTLVRGIWFRNNAPEWGGDGVAFWAAYNGYVYQIQAARKDRDLMDFVMSNWFFAPPTPTSPKK